MKQWLILSLVLLAVAGCDDKSTPGVAVESAPAMSAADYLAAPKNVDLLVYSSNTCGCCEDWVKHMKDNGFSSRIVHPEKLIDVKVAWNINIDQQACHTAVSRQGYVFEGHIPAHVIQRFLAERPRNAIGLAVPGMPVGSPGMEMGDEFEPYDVLLLRKDGKTEVFTRITAPR